MDCTLSMLDHVNHVRKSGFYYINWMKRIRNSPTDESARVIVNALIISKIDYCKGLLIYQISGVIDKPQHLMNAAARVIFRTPGDSQSHLSFDNYNGSMYASASTSRYCASPSKRTKTFTSFCYLTKNTNTSLNSRGFGSFF